MHYRLFSVSLACLALTACSKPTTVDIPFTLSYHNQQVDCDSANDKLALRDFRFYLHNVELREKNGQWQPLALKADAMWQAGNTALIDLENGTAGCELGNKTVNDRIVGTIANGQYDALRFTLGVPFELNHQNPLTAKAPLNESSMHWHWQSGYKFVRAEFTYDGQPRRMHLGSLQCQGEIDNITHCETPNRPTIVLSDFTPGTDGITIELDTLLDYPTQNVQNKLTCMGGSEKPWCRNSLDWIGLGEKPQMAFKVTGAKP